MLLEALWSTSQLQHSHTTQPNLSIIMAADRFSINKSWDQVQNKFVGTGHSDMSKFEWASNQHRDTIASHIGHYDMISYFAVAQNDSVGRVRYQLLEKMLQPCGPPPLKDEEDPGLQD